METKKKSDNVFVDMLYQRHYKKGLSKFLYDIKIRRFFKKMKKSSPDFNMLWNIADFITVAELGFEYDNNSIQYRYTDEKLFSSKDFKRGENGFKIYSDAFTVTIKLYSNKNNKVSLEVARRYGSNASSFMSFTNNDWDGETYSIMNEIILEQVIRLINERVYKLFVNCSEKW